MPARILVAEDDVGIAALLQMALEDEGYVVQVVTDAEAATRHVREQQFALLIADQLDGALNALSDEVRHWVLEVANSQPTILVTARDWAAHLTDAERAALAQELGIAAIVTKPFDVGALLDLVNCLVGARPA